MKEFNSLKDLKNFQGIDTIDEFSLDYSEYKKSSTVKKCLNKALETNYRYVFVSGDTVTTNESLSWDSAYIVCITEKGNVVRMFNSEWAGFEKV